jgi:hypothetical protein
MAHFRYEISRIAAGWQVSCNGVAGAAYSARDAAVLDTLATADQWRKSGHRVEVRLFDGDGSVRVLEPKDARLFAG